MSTGLLLLLLLLGIAITLWRPLRRVRTVLGVNHLISTGHAFLLVGFVAGALVPERPAPVSGDLRPVVAFVAGWVGFATGMRFDLRVLRTVPLRAFGVAVLPALATAIVVGSASAWLLISMGASPAKSFGAALVLAAAAASSGPTLAAIVRTRRPGRALHVRPVLRMIEFSAGFDDIIVVVLALLAFSLFRPGTEPVATGLLLLLALGGGGLLGSAMWLFLGGRATDDERLLLGLAMLAFVAGFGGWLHMSPASISALAAMVVVNLPGDRMALLLRAVRRVERPAVVILMIVIGFHVAGPLELVFLPLVGVMTVLRFAAKLTAGDLVVGRIARGPGLAAERGWGHGLVPQGTLGLMVALSFFHVWDDATARSVLAAVAISSVVNEIAAPWLLYRLLRRLTPTPRPEGDGA